MVLYPQHYAARYASIQAMVEMEVASANQAYKNSGMDTRLRLKYQGVLDLNGDSVISTNLLHSIGGANRVALGNNRKVSELRSIYKPDITVYVSSATNWCGLAYTPSTNLHDPNFPEKALYATSVISMDSICLNAMVHEIGHNLGAGHSDRQTGGVGFSDGFPYPYSRGWGVDYVFATIMSYNSDYSAPWINRFSNPRQRDCDTSGFACGSQTSNAAYYIDLFAERYASTYSSCYPLVLDRMWYSCH